MLGASCRTRSSVLCPIRSAVPPRSIVTAVALLIWRYRAAVPTDPPAPTDPKAERAAGRVALWLDPDDLRWLSKQCDCTDATAPDDRDRCSRIRFRANAALHKTGRNEG